MKSKGVAMRIHVGLPFALVTVCCAVTSGGLILQDKPTALYDVFPETTQGKNGVWLQYRTVGTSCYTNMVSFGDYKWMTPNTPWNVPYIMRTTPGKIRASPAATKQCLFDRDTAIRIGIEGGSTYVRISGQTGNECNTAVSFYIYKGATNWNEPVWVGGRGQSFDLVLLCKNGEELFLATNPDGDDISDWSFWQDVTLCRAPPPSSSLPQHADLPVFAETNRVGSMETNRIAKTSAAYTTATRPFPVSFNSVRNGLVIVRTKHGSGSGFIVERDGKKYVMTNTHVLYDTEELALRTLSGQALAWSSILLADKIDLAKVLLKEPPTEVRPLPLSTHDVTMNESVVIYGNSEGKDVVTELRGNILGVGPETIETSAGFVSGNSGSPILNARGEVVAVATYITRAAPGADWVRVGTRFAFTRRFGVRIVDTKWVAVDPTVLREQVARLNDMDRFMGDAFSIIANWLPEIRGDYRYTARDVLHMYSAKREEANYNDRTLPRSIERFCDAYVTFSSAALTLKLRRPDGRRDTPRASLKSYDYLRAEKQEKELKRECVGLLLSFYEVPQKTIKDTPWLTCLLAEEAQARQVIVDLLRECVTTATNSPSWGRSVNAGVQRKPLPATK